MTVNFGEYRQLTMKDINNVKTTTTTTTTNQSAVEGTLWGTAKVNGSAERDPIRGRKRTIRERMRGKSELEGDWFSSRREISSTQD